MKLPDYDKLLARTDITPEQRQTLERLKAMSIPEQYEVLAAEPEKAPKDDSLTECPICKVWGDGLCHVGKN